MPDTPSIKRKQGDNDRKPHGGNREHGRKADASNGVGRRPERISPLFNTVFLKTFGESEESARSFVNSVLRRVGIPELGEIERMEVDSTRPSSVSVKAPRCDVVLVTGNMKVDLEPQLRYVNVDNKALFYGSRLLSEGTPKGGDVEYGELPQIVVIMLLQGRRRFKGKQFITRCRMAWEREDGMEAGSDRITIVLVEMDKVAEEYNGLTDEVLADELTAWLYLLARGYRSSEETAEIMDYFPDMKSFAEHYGLAIEDPDTKRAFDSYQLDLWENAFIMEQEEKDRRAALEEARARGYGEGFDKGYGEGLDKGYGEGLDRGYGEGLDKGYGEAVEKIITKLREAGIPEEAIAEARRQSMTEKASAEA